MRSIEEAHTLTSVVVAVIEFHGSIIHCDGTILGEIDPPVVLEADDESETEIIQIIIVQIIDPVQHIIAGIAEVISIYEVVGKAVEILERVALAIGEIPVL